jgi:hypothetical protein
MTNGVQDLKMAQAAYRLLRWLQGVRRSESTTAPVADRIYDCSSGVQNLNMALERGTVQDLLISPAA